MDFRPRRMEMIPPVVKNLLIINVLVFFATVVLAKQGVVDLNNHLALYYWGADKFKVWQFVTHLFMHGGNVQDLEMGIMHLFSNMFALWMFGSILENHFGSKRFLTFYMLCGVGASLIYMGVLSYQFSTLHEAVNTFAANPTYKEYVRFLVQNVSSELSSSDSLRMGLKAWEIDANNITIINEVRDSVTNYYKEKMNATSVVGASGAVFGLLFAFGYLFPNTVLYIQFLFPLKAKYFVALYALFELYAGIQNSANDNVAHVAHLAGMLVAFFVLKVWNKSHRNHFY